MVLWGGRSIRPRRVVRRGYMWRAIGGEEGTQQRRGEETEKRKGRGGEKAS